jgi:TorA maturation chaperone TorD
MDTQKIICHETARQDTYKHLAECYRLPGENIRAILTSLVSNLSMLDSEAVSYVQSMRSELDQFPAFDLSAIEYTRLFVGPYSLPAPPYGSIYLEKERKIMGGSTLDARERYQSFGLDVSSNIHEVPDHITIEFEFMFFLIYTEIEAIRSVALEKTRDLLLHQRSFLFDHLNEWIPDFTDCILQYSGTRFYQDLARATRIFIAEDLEYLDRIIVPATQG